MWLEFRRVLFRSDHVTAHALIMWMIIHWSRYWSNTDHVTDHAGLACCDSWGAKESDMTERLNWTELMWDVVSFHSSFPYPAVEIVVSNIFKKKINTKNHGLLQLETTLEITDSVHLNIHVKKWQPRADNCSCREPVTEWGL